ncbi:metal-dependent transcriptional regulator [Fusibacter paucivorans]|uniref:Metal-dependent transcriptional regulator n=1 Tax=Fusibacter paucivorans TaxID=76009 RepID=A0ABS5PNV6_9FIRM|nr:metal-dependent transcriptional regulator [Fusibacter paucivorans]MBS7526858.1 metal-dependent transcriptional regulator [Fusibacter paucivorans]
MSKRQVIKEKPIIKGKQVTSRGEEDYIKAIYKLSDEAEGERVTNHQLAVYFAHTAQTVNEMVRKLEKKEMLVYQPYKGSVLTTLGMEEAVRLIRAHRIWETFLTDKLGYAWEEVHEEAEMLEHLTSTKLADKLYAFLGAPEVCPHGNYIPALSDLKRDDLDTCGRLKLSKAKKGKQYCLKSVVDDKALLVYLNSLNIYIDLCFKIIERDLVSDIVTLTYDGRNTPLSGAVAQKLFVCEVYDAEDNA